MHKSDKERRLNYSDLLMWQHEEYHWQKSRIHVAPSTGTGDYWPPHGKAVIPETPTFSAEQQRARTLAPIFLHIIFFTLPTQKRKPYLYIIINCYGHVLHVATKSTIFISSWLI